MKNAATIRPLIEFWASFWMVPAYVPEAILTIESGGNIAAVNRNERAMAVGGAWGLMQITGDTGPDLWRVVRPALEKSIASSTGRKPEHTDQLARVLATARAGFPQCMLDPNLNVCLGTHYLARLHERYKGQLVCTFAAYHQGPGKVDRMLKAGQQLPEKLPPIGREYVRLAVNALDAIYRRQLAENPTTQPDKKGSA